MALSTSPGVTISYISGQTTYSIKFTEFGDQMPRSYIEAAGVNFSATGAISLTGQTRAARRLWTISSYVRPEIVYQLEDLYQAYEVERASGAAAAVAVSDETRRPEGAAPITATTVFSTAPTFDLISNGGDGIYLVTFGLTEI